MEKLKPCQCCDGADRELNGRGYDERYDEGVRIELEWEDGKPSIAATGYYDGGYICGVARVGIRFCPFCGRRLVKDAE